METLIVRNDEVVGSIPTSSTNLLNYLPTFFAVFDHGKTCFIGPFWTVNWTVDFLHPPEQTPLVVLVLGVAR